MSKNKVIIDKFIKWSLSKLNRWNQYRIKKYGTSLIDNPNNYEVLLPNAKSDNKGYYSDSLKIALDTPRVNNIAITGSYGSGKSSFIETFKEKNAEWNYLPISLATFKNKQDEEPESSNAEDEKENKGKFELHQDIERSILQQFFYREKDSTVAQSRFKKIKKINKFDVLSNAIMISFLTFWSFFLFNHFREKSIDIFPAYLDTYLHQITYVYIFIGLAFLYRVFYYFSNLQISKFNFKKGEITLAKQDKASILNEHLDEILYFFTVTKYDVVFFEDIDRFDDTEIFIKLRELNNLINNSKQINRRIVFIYAIRDDMFIDKERTKFFDYIVPVIPYINPSNSERKLVDKFKLEIENKKLDENFISQVSLYIDDMRLLLNIYNEYMVYKNNLDSEKLNHNQILALVICKNFYPLDFAKLHTREGIIYNLFANKPKYIEEKIKELNSQKISLEKNIKNIKEENIQSVDELKMIYLGKLFAETDADAMTINEYSEKSLQDLLSTNIIEELDNDSNCQALIKAKSPYSNYPLQLNNSKKITFGEVEQLISSKFTYLERKELIGNKYNNKIDELKKEIEKIDKKINRLKQATLKELFETSSALITKGYKDNDLLIFLVRNGYIDEYYEQYISYFHKGGITQDDREFLLSIQNYNALDFNFRLENIRKLLEKLTIKDFKQVEILNFDLTDFLLSNYHNYEDKASVFLRKISDGSEFSIKFIFAYLEHTSRVNKKEFLKKLEWNDLWTYIHEKFSKERQNEYFNLIFNTLDTDRIISLDTDNSLKKYLEKQTILPKYSDSENAKCQKLVKELELHFSNIENPLDNEKLFNYIYENWNYVLSESMIKIMLTQKSNIDITDLEEAHLTTIRNSEAKELIEYINTNIEEYIENVFLNLENNINESEETVLYLLNNENISSENKVKIINKEDIRISDINTVEDKELWIELFKDNKVEATWYNVLYYYEYAEELSKEIIVYLNIESNYINLSVKKIDSEKKFEEDFRKKFNRQIILNNSISTIAYSQVIKSINYYYESSLNFENLDKDKINVLIDNTTIHLSKENLKILKENFSPKHITLIEKFKNEFLEKFDEFEIDEEDLVSLLSSDKCAIDEKFSFIQKSNLSNIEDKVSVKETISKFYIDNTKYIENIDLFNKLFYGENQYGLELLILQIPYLDDCESIKPYLESLKGDHYSELLEKSASKLCLSANALNQLLLEKLKEKGCISSFSNNTSLTDEKRIKVERKRK